MHVLFVYCTYFCVDDGCFNKSLNILNLRLVFKVILVVSMSNVQITSSFGCPLDVLD